MDKINQFKSHQEYRRIGAFMWMLCFVASQAPALDGNMPVNITTLNGWSTFELVTQNDYIGAISDRGYGNRASWGEYDGLGSYVNGNSLVIFVNHETDPGAVSRVELNLSSFQQAINSSIGNGITPMPSFIVSGMGYAYDTIYDASYHASDFPNPVASGTAAVAGYGADTFLRFCSGTSYRANAFGVDRGFVNQIYITGEESLHDSTGQLMALDPVTRTFWDVPDAGRASYENAAQVDTGNTTHTAMLMSEDRKIGRPLRLYVGKKGIDSNGDDQIDFLEQNGLRGGTVYYFIPDSGSTTDLPDGSVSGKWSTSSSGALTDALLEDIHSNPMDGTQLVLAAQSDGVYRIDLNMQFSDGSFDTSTSTARIYQILTENLFAYPDNVTWSADGKVYVEQDGEKNGIYQMDSDGGNIVKIARADSEPSGIFDVSEYAGYLPGSVFLTSVLGNGNSGAQLIVLISPTAALD